MTHRDLAEGPAERRWFLKQGSSRATVRAVDYEGAKARGRQIGFDDPEVVRLLDEVPA